MCPLQSLFRTGNKVIIYMSRGTEYDIWAGFGPVGSTENFGLGLMRAIFLCFHGQNIVASTQKTILGIVKVATALNSLELQWCA